MDPSISPESPSKVIISTKTKKELNYQLCNLSRHSSTRRAEIKNPKQNVTTKSFSCETCNSTFQKRENLVRHTAKVHSLETECPVDGCSVRTRSAYLQRHLAAAHATNDKAQCEHCGGSYSHWYIGRHVRACRKNDSAIEERFECKVCGVDFATAERRSYHFKTRHRDPERIECSWEGCGAEVRRGSMRNHVWAVHERRMTKCPECEAEVLFTNMSNHKKTCAAIWWPLKCAKCSGCGNAVPKDKMDFHREFCVGDG